MKEMIISFVMSAVVATAVGWVKDKVAFPLNAVEKLKGMAQEVDTQSLAMKSLGGDMDHQLLLGLPKCLSENKDGAVCLEQGAGLLKNTLAKRGETVKAAETATKAASELSKLVEDAPFSDSVKPLLAPITGRIKTATEGLGAAQGQLDDGMVSIAGKLLALKGGSTQLAGLLTAMKDAGLEKALEKAKIAIPASTK